MLPGVCGAGIATALPIPAVFSRLNLLTHIASMQLPTTCTKSLMKNLALAVLVMQLALSPANASEVSGTPEQLSEFSECTIGNAAGLLDAQCATFSVPLNYDEPAGQTIELKVALLESQSNDPKPDPFTLIAGGPGQSATESFPSVSYAFRHIRQERDIVLLDQRGTGESNKLDCPHDEDEEPSLIYDKVKTEAAARKCRDALGIDPRYFTTSVAVKDLEALRKAMNIEQWNVYGVSYGTRVALHYLRRYQEQVRTLILDAVVPPELTLGPDIALAAQRALLRLFDRCEADAGCHDAFPELRSGTLNLLEQLKQQPVSIEYEDIGNGTLRKSEFTDKHLAITLRLMSYSAHGNAILPSMLSEAINNNNFAALARQADLQMNSLDESLAGGMHNAIICTEDTPFVERNMDRSALDQTYIGSELLDAMFSNCTGWLPGVLDDDFKTPVVSSVPTLVLSGSDDPVTPPEYGDRVTKHLSNSLHLVNENQGHMQASLGCMPKVLAEFIVQASVEDTPVSCLERIRAPSFFIDANGPLP